VCVCVCVRVYMKSAVRAVEDLWMPCECHVCVCVCVCVRVYMKSVMRAVEKNLQMLCVFLYTYI
jgi:hypothetical protein